MGLTLKIENLTTLPDGGPLSVRATGTRGLDIGRDSYLDWTLPDQGRFISSKHCEVRHRDGAYWLNDVSTNGTFLYGNDKRVQSPYRMKNGDRLVIGQYIVAVEIDGDEEAYAQGPDTADYGAAPDNVWAAADAPPPPIDPRELMPQKQRPAHADPMDWFIDIPQVETPAPRAKPAAPAAFDSWDSPQAPAASAPASSHNRDEGWRQPAARAPEPPAAEPRRPQPEPAMRAAPLAPAEPTGGGVTSAQGPFRRTGADETRGGDAGEFRRHLARGAGIPPDAFGNRTNAELAELLGSMVRILADELRALLIARAETKGIVRSSNQTMIQAIDNNPFRFSPTAADALKIIFGPATTSYLDGPKALDQSFRDLKNHQLATFAAMQQAIKIMLEDFDPATIDKSVETDRGIGAMMGSRKTRLWDTFVTKWQAKSTQHGDGFVDTFMVLFAKCYDQASRKVR